jgi:hypothetical protein
MRANRVNAGWLACVEPDEKERSQRSRNIAMFKNVNSSGPQWLLQPQRAQSNKASLSSSPLRRS